MADCLFCGGTGQQNEHRRDNGDPLGRAINESHRYQAMLFQAWLALRGQTKGLQRQRRLIKRLQAENARLRGLRRPPAWCGCYSMTDGLGNSQQYVCERHRAENTSTPIREGQP